LNTLNIYTNIGARQPLAFRYVGRKSWPKPKIKIKLKTNLTKDRVQQISSTGSLVI